MTEYHSKGSLGDQLLKINDELEEKCVREGRKEDIKKMGLNQNRVRLYFIDMLKALYYCHKIIKVIHRDIKPDNIMINHNNEAVLIDFGVSALVDQQEDDLLKDTMGTYMIFAPEMFQTEKSQCVKGEKTDLWALGVTLYFLLTYRYPLGEEASNPLQLRAMILTDDIDFECIKNYEIRKLLERMLHKDP